MTGISVEQVAQRRSGVRVEEPAEGVRLLVLDRPAQRNALDAGVIGTLLEELGRVGEDASVRALVLHGAGGAFSAGADFGGIDFRGLRREEIEPVMRAVLPLGQLLYDVPQPTIAAISGPVAGGALGLALACDVRIGGPDASFLSPFIHMGLVPDCGATWLMPRLAGEGRALELMLGGRPIGAAAAERAGLLTRVENDPLAEALELARTLARRPPQAVRLTKRLVREAGGGDLRAAIEREAVAQAQAFAGAEFEAGFEGWRDNRRPD
ncbi:MAG TPA: enoyl-CoA hydratase-related protein [Solirubrobacteraceae bacterium]|nr:enoyl-CoA hydratase-related protein [Solirubrobacteraceae bacterium]